MKNYTKLFTSFSDTTLKNLIISIIIMNAKLSFSHIFTIHRTNPRFFHCKPQLTASDAINCLEIKLPVSFHHLHPGLFSFIMAPFKVVVVTTLTVHQSMFETSLFHKFFPSQAANDSIDSNDD